MSENQWLIRVTAWIAFVLYVNGEGVRTNANGHLFRWLSTFGCLAMVLHMLCAFHYRYHWSHAAAYADTARQTAEITGWNWGGGIYFNYGFVLLWISEVTRSWMKPSAAVGWTAWASRGLFLFMFLNAAVIFVRSPIRWLGLAGCLCLAGFWFSPNTRFVKSRSARPHPDSGAAERQE